MVGLFFTLLFSPLAHAGLMELELSVLYRTSSINEDNYTKSTSYTGGFSYYFGEMSAIEFTYTRGVSELSIKASDADPQTLFKSLFEMYGVDLVFTLAGRESAIQPYVKFGGAHISKEIVRVADGGSQGSDKVESPEGVVPSAGVGLKLRLSKAFTIKMGVDAWTSPLSEDSDENDSIRIDFAGRAGIAWLF